MSDKGLAKKVKKWIQDSGTGLESISGMAGGYLLGGAVGTAMGVYTPFPEVVSHLGYRVGEMSGLLGGTRVGNYRIHVGDAVKQRVREDMERKALEESSILANIAKTQGADSDEYQQYKNSVKAHLLRFSRGILREPTIRFNKDTGQYKVQFRKEYPGSFRPELMRSVKYMLSGKSDTDAARDYLRAMRPRIEHENPQVKQAGAFPETLAGAFGGGMLGSLAGGYIGGALGDGAYGAGLGSRIGGVAGLLGGKGFGNYRMSLGDAIRDQAFSATRDRAAEDAAALDRLVKEKGVDSAEYQRFRDSAKERLIRLSRGLLHDPEIKLNKKKGTHAIYLTAKDYGTFKPDLMHSLSYMFSGMKAPEIAKDYLENVMPEK